MKKITLNYLFNGPEKFRIYRCHPPPGQPERNLVADKRLVKIVDARAVDPMPTLDSHGFELTQFFSKAEDFYRENTLASYYKEVEDHIKRVTGTERVVAFDHILRNRAEFQSGKAQKPAYFVHNDYTAESAKQRVRELLEAQAEELLKKRFAIINLWKPLRAPVNRSPLALCDSNTLEDQDAIEVDMVYKDRIGKIVGLKFNPNHRWYYFPNMTTLEAILIKCHDSDLSVAFRSGHGAFHDPDTPETAPPRESIEVRTLVFY